MVRWWDKRADKLEMKVFSPFFLFLMFFGVLSSCSHVQKTSEKALLEEKMPSLRREERLNHYQKKKEEAFQELQDLSEKKIKTYPLTLKRRLYFLVGEAEDLEQKQDYFLLQRMLVKTFPEDSFLKEKYFKSLILANKIVEATAFMESIANEDLSTESKLLKANLLMVAQKYSGATLIYEKILAEEINEEACLGYAQIKVVQNKESLGLKKIKECLEQDPINPRYDFFLARLAIEKENLTAAKKYLASALQRDPLHSASLYLMGAIAEEEREYSKAISYFEKATKIDPSNLEILGSLVRLLMAHSRFEEVIPYMERFVDLVPESEEFKLQLATLYSTYQREQDAIDLLEHLQEETKAPARVNFYLGTLYLQQKKYTLAEQNFTSVFSDKSLGRDAVGQVLKIKILKTLVAYSKKEKRRREVLQAELLGFYQVQREKRPQLKVPLAMELVDYYEKTEQFSAAIAVTESVRTKEPTEQYLYYLASLYEKNKEYEKSYKIIKDILAKNPNNAHALNFIAYSLIDREVDLPQAYQYIRQAISLAPDDAYIRDSLGWYYYKVKKYHQALKEILRAKEKIPNDATIAKHLGMIYRELKKFSLSKEFFIQAVKNSETENERLAILKEIEILDQYVKTFFKDARVIRLPSSVSEEK